MKAFVEKHEVSCDFRYATTIDVCLSQEFADQQAESFKAFKAAGGDTSHIKIYEGDVAKATSRVSSTISAYEWPAGSIHPAKLTHWILNDIISQGARLWTHCPGIKVVKNQDESASGLRWDVHTPRGIIAAETVIHCTNAYAAFLLPEVSHYITPCRSQVHAFVPSMSASGEKILQHTMSLRYGLRHFFSVNQRLADGIIILGGTGTRTISDSGAEPATRAPSFDDTTHNEQLAENSKREYSDVLIGTGTTSRPGEGLLNAWTGIIGLTPDSVPLIGPIDQLDGQWICAGFNGHGESLLCVSVF